MTSPDLPEGSGASHSSEDWMKVLDRFLESGSGENGVAGSNAAGAGGESCDDLFLFAQLDGSLFQDTDTNLINPLQFYNQSSPRVGSVIVNNNTATTTISRNRSSSISLTSLIQNTYTNNVSIPMSTNHDHDHHPRQETKISENWMSNFRANIQNHGTSHEHENRHSSMHEIHPQLSYTTTQLPMNKRSKVDTATAASHEDEATADDDDNDLDEEADDPEDTNSFTTDSELKNQQSKYERKRTLERRRRLDTKSQFDALAVTLLEIEQEFLIQEDPDEEEVGSGHNSKQKDTSSSSSSISKRPKNGPPATCFKTTTNRLDLISRAIVALQRLQDNVHSLKKDKKALKKVIYKLNALSTDHIHPIPSSSSCNHHSRPITTATTASISSVITVPQPSCATSQSQTLVNGLAPSCSIQGAGTVPFHRAAAAAASSAVADATHTPSTPMMHTMPTMMYPYNHHPLFLPVAPSLFSFMPIPQQNYLQHQNPNMIPTIPPTQQNTTAASASSSYEANMNNNCNTQQQLFPSQVPAIAMNSNIQHLYSPQQANAMTTNMQTNLQYPYPSLAYHMNHMIQQQQQQPYHNATQQQQQQQQVTAVTGPVQTTLQHLYPPLSYHVPYTFQHPNTSFLQTTPDMASMVQNVQTNAITEETADRSHILLRNQSQTLPTEDSTTRPTSDDTSTSVDNSRVTHLAHCA